MEDLLEDFSVDEIKKFSLITIKLKKNEPLAADENLQGFDRINLGFFQTKTQSLAPQDYQDLIRKIDTYPSLVSDANTLSIQEKKQRAI